MDVATHIAAAGFVQGLTAELRHDVESHLLGGQLVYGVYQGEIVKGFAIFNTFDDLLYLSGIILMPEVQGKGVAAQVVRFAQASTNAKYLALRTQSLRMWVAGRTLCREWLPSSEPSDSILHHLGRDMAGRLNMGYPIARRCYGGPLYGEKPVHRDTQLQAWWDSVCDFQRGDAVLCIGSL